MCGGQGGGKYLRWRCLLGVFIASSLLVACGGGGYASPFALLSAASAFFLVRESAMLIHFGGAIAVFLSNTMFSVYLLHAESEGYEFIRWAERRLTVTGGVDMWVSFAVIAVSIFMGGILLDFPRRAIEFAYCRIKNKIKRYVR